MQEASVPFYGLFG